MIHDGGIDGRHAPIKGMVQRVIGTRQVTEPKLDDPLFLDIAGDTVTNVTMTTVSTTSTAAGKLSASIDVPTWVGDLNLMVLGTGWVNNTGTTHIDLVGRTVANSTFHEQKQSMTTSVSKGGVTTTLVTNISAPGSSVTGEFRFRVTSTLAAEENNFSVTLFGLGTR